MSIPFNPRPPVIFYKVSVFDNPQHSICYLNYPLEYLEHPPSCYIASCLLDSWHCFMGYERGSLRYVTSCLAFDGIGLLFIGPLVLRVLFIFSTRGLRGPRVLGSGFYSMPFQRTRVLTIYQ